LTAVPETGEVLPGVPLDTGAVVGLALVAATLAVAPWILALARRLFPGRNVAFARWGFSHVAVLVALVVLSSAVAAAVVLPGEDEPGLLTQLWVQCFVNGGAVLFVGFVAERRSPDGVRSLGLPRGRHLRALGTGLGVYLLTLPALSGLGAAWPFALEALGAEPRPQEWLALFSEARGVELAVAAALAVLVVPLFEEVLFRAFLQPLLVQNFSEKGGVLLTALVFAWLHGQESFLPIFGLSIVLGGLMLRTQRLACVYGVHAFHNALTLAMTLALAPEGGLSPPGLASVFSSP
jgi:membrane protease YdiL (CAAX protease family)